MYDQPKSKVDWSCSEIGWKMAKEQLVILGSAVCAYVYSYLHVYAYMVVFIPFMSYIGTQ